MAMMICNACGHLGKSTRVTRGSLVIELVAWLCFLIPGLFYSLWRMFSKFDACAACRSPDIIPIDSPKGRRLLEEFHPNADTRTAAERAGEMAGRAVDRLADRINRTLGG